MMRHSVKKMTRQIINFYETLEDILLSDGTKNVDLTYSAYSAELNELQLAFNKFVKVINISNKTLKEGSEYRAMLDYAEAYHIFADFENAS